MIGEAKEIQSLAVKYSKPQLARMAQMGLIDTQKAVLAAMMRDRIAKEDAKPPTTTVAQDVMGMQPQMAQAQPQQQQQPMGMPQGQTPQQPVQMAASGGLTSIPVHMSDYAGGGIVAFDDGGQVKRYDGSQESFVESSPIARRFSGFMAPSSEEDMAAYKEMLANQERQRVLTRRQSELGGLFGFRKQNQADKEEYERNAQELNDIYRKGNRLERTPKYGEVTPQEGAQQNFSLNPEQFATPLSSPTIAQEAAAAATKEKPPGIPGGTRTSAPLPPLGGVADVKFTPHKLNDIPSIREGLDRLKEADREAGVDTEIYDKLRGELEGKKGKVKERKEEAIGNALMQAGLGLMGAKQGYEFQALGESGQKALAGLVASNEKIRDYEDKIEDKQRDLMMAENEYKRTNSKTALNRIDTLTDKRDALEARNVEEQNKLAQHRQTIDVQLRQQDISREQNLIHKDLGERQIAAMYRPDSYERATAQYNHILKTEGKEAADQFMSVQNKIRGYDRGQNMGGAKIAIAAEAAIAKQEKANPSLAMEYTRNPELRAQAVQEEYNRIIQSQGGSGIATTSGPISTYVPGQGFVSASPKG